MSVFLQHRNEVRAVYERNRFIFCEIVGVWAKTTGSDEDSSICTFIDDRAIQISNGSNVYRASIALRLNNVFPAAKRIGIIHHQGPICPAYPSKPGSTR
jgi:hypothetical protein